MGIANIAHMVCNEIHGGHLDLGPGRSQEQNSFLVQDLQTIRERVQRW